MEIRPFLGVDAAEDELRQWYELNAENSGSVFPGFPVRSYRSFALSAREPEDHLGPRRIWAAWDGRRLVGIATLAYPRDDERAPAFPKLIVIPGERRRGVATALLRALVADVRAQGRARLRNEQVRIGGAGAAWAVAVGFAEVNRNAWQMLQVQDVDPEAWNVPVPAGFRLERWADAAPEALVSSFAEARNAILDAPSVDPADERREWTAERVRADEAGVRATEDDYRFVVAVHEETGAVAALTGMVLTPGRTDLCWQRDTAVVGKFRGLGLGRSVKAAMMRELLADFPALQRVITSTAAQNAAMIRVNEQVGYVPYAEIGTFEATLEDIEAALAGQSLEEAKQREVREVREVREEPEESIPGPRLAAEDAPSRI